MFKPGFNSQDEMAEQAFWFLFQNGRLLIQSTDRGYRIPEADDVAPLLIAVHRKEVLGKMKGRLCCAADLQPEEPIPGGFQAIDIRALFGGMSAQWVEIAGLANQIMDWDRTHRYCGKCGNPTENKADERAKICRQCGLVNYPRLCPAVIVAVLKGDRILLARNKRFRLPFYSVLAGFVEPGETLEECVKREVFEEVGISIENLRYFGSQPWPFPNSLMIGFVAAYAGGEITVDNAEIDEASWFSRDALPRIPPKISIARRLIDSVLAL